MGMLATNTIAQGDTRLASLDHICAHGGTIYNARRTFVWPGHAKLHASWVCISKTGLGIECHLDFRKVPSINSLLDPYQEQKTPQILVASKKRAFRGSMVAGEGFVIDVQDADRLSSQNPQLQDVIFDYLTGEDLNQRPDQTPSRRIIDFGDRSAQESQQYQECFAIVEATVKPQRMQRGSPDTLKRWWQFGRRAVNLYEAIVGLKRVVVCSQVSKHFAMCFVPTGMVYSSMVVVFAFEDSSAFGVLQSTLKEAWAREYSSTLKSDLRYTPSSCFETFAFPAKYEKCREIGQKYHDLRRKAMEAHEEGLEPIRITPEIL
jgi:hypothetical protein